MADDVDELAGLIGKRFIERRDVKAVQRQDGNYQPVQEYDAVRNPIEGTRKPFTMSDLRAHIAGDQTFGHYLVSQENKCRVLAFDIDLAKEGTLGARWGSPADPVECGVPLRQVWLSAHKDRVVAKRQLTTELRCMAGELAARAHDLLEMPVAVAYSGSKGVHVYVMTGQVDALDARAAGVAVLESFSGPMKFDNFRGSNFFRLAREDDRNLEIEIYPKQDDIIGKDLGNLLRLPLGINRKTGHRAFFLDVSAPVDQLVETDALEVLTNGVAL